MREFLGAKLREGAEAFVKSGHAWYDDLARRKAELPPNTDKAALELFDEAMRGFAMFLRNFEEECRVSQKYREDLYSLKKNPFRTTRKGGES